MAGRQARRSHQLRPVYLGDDLFASQPIAAAVQQAGGDFIFVCKPASHPIIKEYITGVELEEHRSTVKRGHQRSPSDLPLAQPRCRCATATMPLTGELVRDRDPAMPPASVTYRNSFITDLPVGRDNVAELAACGRARWKIENETFNVATA